MTDPDHYRLLSGELTRTGDDGERETIVEGDVFKPTKSELDAFGDRLTRADNDNDASARETGHPLAVTRRSYHMMKHYDSRDLQARSSRGREVTVDWDQLREQTMDPSDHPQSEEQQNLPEQPDLSRAGPRFGIPKRSPLSSGTPWRNLAEGTAAGDADTSTGSGVADAVDRIEALARDYADNDVEMTNAEYERKLDAILADMDVGDAIDALEEIDIGAIRV